jgi:nitroimidazol reductase NimA-like FMN-containing flavoprotein (pyridoxamine 5'-phosphate oxidase superfamily)
MAYTQPPHLTDEELEALLEEAKIARFCSLNPDGTIHAVPVNHKYENGRILIVTPAASRKARNVSRNGAVTVLIDVEGERVSDFKAAIVYGKAVVKAATLSEIMLVGSVWMPADRVEALSKRFMELTDWVMITVEPERTASFDYAKDKEFAAVLER